MNNPMKAAAQLRRNIIASGMDEIATACFKATADDKNGPSRRDILAAPGLAALLSAAGAPKPEPTPELAPAAPQPHPGKDTLRHIPWIGKRPRFRGRLPREASTRGPHRPSVGTVPRRRRPVDR